MSTPSPMEHAVAQDTFIQSVMDAGVEALVIVRGTFVRIETDQAETEFIAPPTADGVPLGEWINQREERRMVRFANGAWWFGPISETPGVEQGYRYSVTEPERSAWLRGDVGGAFARLTTGPNGH